MGKTIVFCADGTWNGPTDDSDGVAGRTNVYRLFADLAGALAANPLLIEQERNFVDPSGKHLQIAKYLHGVGNSDNPIVKMLGGTVGAGLIARIVRGYTFISRNYLAGDSIYIVGFSRGSYTARALTGMISAVGLLDATSTDLTDKVHAYRLGLTVWYDYRRQFNRGAGILGDLRGFFDTLILMYLDHTKSVLIPHVPIEAVAVWDTVGSLGIPLYDHGATLDCFQFDDLKLPPAVRTAIHAVATDEQRMTFTPTLWDPDIRVTQALFPGAHGDVGGGYEDFGGLADIAYGWLSGRLAGLGALFDPQLSWVLGNEFKAIGHQPWLTAPWPDLGVGLRTFPADIRVSTAIVQRMAAGPVPLEDGTTAIYAPLNQLRFRPGYSIDATDIEP